MGRFGVHIPFLLQISSAWGITFSSTYCDANCTQLALLGSSWEQTQHAHSPLDAFYSVPDSFSASSAPGTLLRVEQHTNLTNYTIPAGLTMSRILYTSRDVNGSVVPVSAYALWPYSAVDQNGDAKAKTQLPLIAWAHGTSGSFQSCAPSNYKALQYHFMVPFHHALNGYAVIAPDYAGLGAAVLPNGTTIQHQYNTPPAGANDLAYAIEAVRKAFPERLARDGPFVAMGHSQGGGVAYGFAERQAVSPVEGYRGTVSISPPKDTILEGIQAWQLVSNMTSPLPEWATSALGLQPAIIAAVTSMYPAYNYSGMTSWSYDRWNNVLAKVQGCLPTYVFLFQEATVAELAKPGWWEDATVKAWQKLTSVGGRKFAGPLLVLSGGEDIALASDIELAVDASCALAENQGQDLEMITYSGMQHFANIQASSAKWSSWIKERIDGGKLEKKCGKKSVVQGLDTAFSSPGLSPNWLIEGVGAQEKWKLNL